MPKTDWGVLPRQSLLRLQQEILELVATGVDLYDVMDRLCRRVEGLAPHVICSIIAVDQAGLLQPIAAPSLPDSYSESLRGFPIGPEAGSCGTAAYRNQPVVVTDIETDPRWLNFKDVPLQEGLRACWSSPIQARDGKVIGSFAFYARSRRGPTLVEREIVRACLNVCSIAIEQHLAISHIRRVAYVDAVTGLANRAAFQERAGRAVDEAADGGCILAIHYIDLDNFKSVNDTLGHPVGDRLLQAIAERLRSVAGEAMVSRLGGDEFAILQAAGRRCEIEALARCALAAFEEPFRAGDHDISMAASIGIALAPDDAGSLTDLMKHADLALYRAKADGRSHYRFYCPEMAAAMQARHDLEQGLKRALEADELQIVYQPLIRLATGAITSCEALLRWRHPSRGVVMPADFIHIAEKCGLISRIGSWVMREACREAVHWPEDIAVAVNISPVQFQRAGFAREVRAALTESGLSATRLELEITESTVLTEDVATRAAVAEIAEMGVRLVLDDFGTGYSSLRFLRSFPIRKIKIDRSFVQEFGENPLSTSILRTMIALARDLGMITTAEGIETPELAQRLLAEGCTEGQGFHFSPPRTAESLAAMLASQRAEAHRQARPA